MLKRENKIPKGFHLAKFNYHTSIASNTMGTLDKRAQKLSKKLLTKKQRESGIYA